jgi:hypothetical protein
MALEYVFYSSANLTVAEFHAFVADAADGEVGRGFVESGALQVTALREDLSDQGPIAALLGFVNRITATYRLSSRAEEPERDQGTLAMIRSLLAVHQRYVGDGVLLYNDDRVILQWLGGGPVVLDEDWADWTDVAGMADLVQGLLQTRLPQPLL